MRRVALLSCLLVLASCTPDYGHTAFRCDDEHRCPADQTCITGRCRRGAPTGDGVVCGAATCTLTEQCCLYSFGPPRCIAAGELCPNTSALCDGVEDCASGDRCCGDGEALLCDATCADYVCRDAADCPSIEPYCCGATAQMWGQCSPFPC